MLLVEWKWKWNGSMTWGCGNRWEAKLSKADFHGAIVEVIRSNCPTYVGATGIIIQETRDTVLVCSKENKLMRTFLCLGLSSGRF